MVLAGTVSRSATASVLTADPADENAFESPERITPLEATVGLRTGGYRYPATKRLRHLLALAISNCMNYVGGGLVKYTPV